MQKLLFLSLEPKSTTPACMVPDVTFVVEEAEIRAHRLILAMQSSVFAAELLGDMRESATRRVVVDDMSASTFRAMIRFIYTDEMPIKGKATIKRGCKEKCAARRRVDMALDLLVAADRYDLEKLRLMCEKILSESIDIASVIPTLMAVHGRHSCPGVTDKVATCKLVDSHAYTSLCRPEQRTVLTYNTSEVAHGIHELRIPNFKSLHTSHGVKQRFSSDTFQIGGHDWKLEVSVKEGRISVFTELLTDPGTASVRVSLCFMIDDPGGNSPLIMWQAEETFNSEGDSCGFSCLISQEDDVSVYADDGSLTIRCDFVLTNKLCTVTSATSAGVEDMTLAPPPNIVSHLEQLLVSEKGADVTFLVENREIHAHSLINATRSPALYTMVLATNQEEEYIVPVWGMRVEVFKAVLRFIYTDELPPLEEIALATGHGVTTIAQDMLVAASRFHLDRMKDKCDTLVGECVSERNVVTMLGLACHHNCKKLEDYCMKFN
ncbi:hypothetical protein VPH35_041880 [Triticum aestivum]